MSDEIKQSLWGMPVRVDESIPANDFHFQHSDGRIDKFTVIENEVLPIHLTKLGDAPNWACPICSHINPCGADKCGLCGLSM